MAMFPTMVRVDVGLSRRQPGSARRRARRADRRVNRGRFWSRKLGDRARQLFDIKRFANVSANTAGGIWQLGISSSGDDYDRYRRTTRDRATAIGELPPVQAREHQVQDDHVRPDLAYVLERLDAILCGYDLVPAVGKVVGNHPLDPRVIVDNQDAGQGGTSRL